MSHLSHSPASRVVGVLSTADGLGKLDLAARPPPCDLVELRLDRLPPGTAWQTQAGLLESRGLPVILTLRLANEGGHWTRPDRERLPVFAEAAKVVSLLDVEFKSLIAHEVAALAKSEGKQVIVSFHDFEKTPAYVELAAVAEEAQAFASIVKISTMAHTQADLAILEKLLAGGWQTPVCVMGMGPIGAASRLTFASKGSCLTYGYLDQPSAPGQWSAADLFARLRARPG